MRRILSNLFIESMEQFSVAVEANDSHFWKVRKDFRFVSRLSGNEICIWIFRLPGGCLALIKLSLELFLRTS